jgi:hypothetical protein
MFTRSGNDFAFIFRIPQGFALSLENQHYGAIDNREIRAQTFTWLVGTALAKTPPMPMKYRPLRLLFREGVSHRLASPKGY